MGWVVTIKLYEPLDLLDLINSVIFLMCIINTEILICSCLSSRLMMLIFNLNVASCNFHLQNLGLNPAYRTINSALV